MTGKNDTTAMAEGLEEPVTLEEPGNLSLTMITCRPTGPATQSMEFMKMKGAVMQKAKMIQFTQAVRQLMMSQVMMKKLLILVQSKMMKPLVLQLIWSLGKKAGKQTLLMLGIFNCFTFFLNS